MCPKGADKVTVNTNESAQVATQQITTLRAVRNSCLAAVARIEKLQVVTDHDKHQHMAHAMNFDPSHSELQITPHGHVAHSWHDGFSFENARRQIHNGKKNALNQNSAPFAPENKMQDCMMSDMQKLHNPLLVICNVLVIFRATMNHALHFLLQESEQCHHHIEQIHSIHFNKDGHAKAHNAETAWDAFF